MLLRYNHPENIKKVFSNFRAIRSEYIHMLFTPTYVRIYGQDHENKTNTCIIIDTDRLSEYACTTPIFFTVMYDQIDLVIQKIDKKYREIQISYKPEKRSEVTISLFRRDIDVEEEADIAFSQLDDERSMSIRLYMENFKNNSALYPVRFTMVGSHIKRLIGSIKKFSSTVMITHDPAGLPLVMSYVSNKKSVIARNKYKNSSQIDLESSAKAPISVAFECDMLRDFVSSSCENVYIALHATEPPIMYISLDSGIITSTFIVSYVR